MTDAYVAEWYLLSYRDIWEDLMVLHKLGLCTRAFNYFLSTLVKSSDILFS